MLSTTSILSKTILKHQKIITPTSTLTSILLPQQQRKAHTVPIYLLKQVPNKGGGDKGQIINVKAGYARNHLIPQKYAIYATEGNLQRIGINDISTKDILDGKHSGTSTSTSTTKEEDSSVSDDKKQADILKRYISNKKLTIWRKIDDTSPKLCHPGMVDGNAIRQKLSKQLKIDLDESETILIKPEPFESLEKIIDPSVDEIMKTDDSFSKDAQLKKLGTYVCKICLAGGFDIPLILVVKKR